MHVAASTSHERSQPPNTSGLGRGTASRALKFLCLIYTYSTLQAPVEAKALVRVGSGALAGRACLYNQPARLPQPTSSAVLDRFSKNLPAGPASSAVVPLHAYFLLCNAWQLPGRT
jgi:hypothetical protein